jgi:hypothetical protein
MNKEYGEISEGKIMLTLCKIVYCAAYSHRPCLYQKLKKVQKRAQVK